MKWSNLCDKEFKVMALKILTRIQDKQSKNFNNEMENIGKKQREVRELKNAIAALKNTLNIYKIQKKKKNDSRADWLNSKMNQ